MPSDYSRLQDVRRLYRFQEGSGTTVADEGADGVDLTLGNGTGGTWGTDVVAGLDYYDLEGTDWGSFNTYTRGGMLQHSIEILLNVNAWSEDPANSYTTRFVSAADNFELRGENSISPATQFGAVANELHYAGVGALQTAESYASGDWLHVVITFYWTTKRWRIYVDGVQVAENATLPTSTAAESLDLLLGWRPGRAAAERADMKVALCAVYDFELDADEVALRYADGQEWNPTSAEAIDATKQAQATASPSAEVGAAAAPVGTAQAQAAAQAAATVGAAAGVTSTAQQQATAAAAAGVGAIPTATLQTSTTATPSASVGVAATVTSTKQAQAMEAASAALATAYAVTSTKQAQTVASPAVAGAGVGVSPTATAQVQRTQRATATGGVAVLGRRLYEVAAEDRSCGVADVGRSGSVSAEDRGFTV